MVFSQLLLALFSIYWLNTQFIEEKEVLRKELRQYYYNAINSVAHIQTYRSVIKPILDCKDSADYKNIQLIGLDIELPDKVALSKSIGKIIDRNNYRNIITEYFEKDSLLAEMDETLRNVFNEIWSVLYRHKLMISYYPHQNRKNRGETNITFDEDLMKDLFKKVLEQNNIHLLIEWIPPDVKLKKKPEELSIARYYSNSKTLETEVLFKQYRWYLLKKIAPQIVFIIVLIGITCFALISTYRNYINQIQLNILRSEFISNISHELKIPVATAKVALEALKNFGQRAKPEVMAEYMDMVVKEMERLDKLTSIVLEHSKMEKHNYSLKMEKKDLQGIIKAFVNAMNLLYAAKGLKINYIPVNFVIPVYVDQFYVESVLRNLIDNSIKYGDTNVLIQIDVWLDGDMAYASVADNGPGIPEQYLDKIFDKFFRVPSGDIHNVKGFGLGLSFASLVMKQHNGAINAENLKDKGSKFTLRFPIFKEEGNRTG